MRALVLLAIIAAILAVSVFAFYMSRMLGMHLRARRWAKASWRDELHVTDSHTWVVVQRVYATRFGRHVLAEQLVAMIRANDPRYDELVKANRMTAYNRAIDLNNGSLTDGA